MTRRSYARLDRYCHPNCDECRIYPAVVGNLCVRCDHARWQREQEENDILLSEQRQDAQDARELYEVASGR